MTSAPRELVVTAPDSDAAWNQALGPVGPRTLFAFDYDGTLAPMVPDIGQAWMTGSTQGAFARLLGVAGARVAILTGREASDVRHYFDPLLPLAPGFVIGNHGSDTLDPADMAPRLAAWRPALESAVAQVPGAELESKSLGFSLHWRRAADPALAERVLGAAVSSLQDARIIGGKCVLNVLPAEASHKGDALASLVDTEQFEHVLFVGDDVTDELAFAHPFTVPFTSIRVGALPAGGTRAQLWLREQTGVDALLARLVHRLVEMAPAESVG